jgi:predicted ATPase
MNIAATLQQFHHNVPEVRALAEAGHALCMEQGISYWLTWGPILQGWTLAQQGQGEEGIAQQQQGLTAYSATGAELVRPYFFALLAESYGKSGKPSEGLRVLSEAFEVVEKTQERWWEAELHRLQGELLLAVSATHARAAEDCFRQALAFARRQQARSLELRAAKSLSRLWQHQGKHAEARQLLAEVYDLFTEGFDTADLREAKALLEELA